MIYQTIEDKITHHLQDGYKSAKDLCRLIFPDDGPRNMDKTRRGIRRLQVHGFVSYASAKGYRLLKKGSFHEQTLHET